MLSKILDIVLLMMKKMELVKTLCFKVQDDDDDDDEEENLGFHESRAALNPPCNYSCE